MLPAGAPAPVRTCCEVAEVVAVYFARVQSGCGAGCSDREQGLKVGVLAGWMQIMCDVGKNDIQEHVRVRLEAEKEEKEQRRREKQEAHLYTVFRLVTDQDLRDQIGQTRWFDLADQDKVHSCLRIVLEMTL